VSIAESTYGRVVARTAPGARCTVEVRVDSPKFGDVPPAAIDATADASGTLAVTYAAPVLPKQTARHVVTCGTAVASADVAIAGYPITPQHFTARIRVAGVTDQIDGVTDGHARAEHHRAGAGRAGRHRPDRRGSANEFLPEPLVR